MRLIESAFALVVLLIGSAAADDVREHGGLMVKDVWSRATPARNGVAYMTIFNHGHHMDRLVAAETPVSNDDEPSGAADFSAAPGRLMDTGSAERGQDRSEACGVAAQ